MTDETSLIDFVWANRAEPLPRLIYADWLDDIGDPPSSQKAAFLRLWCRLRDTPLSDLDGYPDLSTQLEALKSGLEETWLRVMDGHRFRIADANVARARAAAFLCRIFQEGDFEIALPSEGENGWIVPFSWKPTVDVVDLPKREKEHKRGGPRTAKRTHTPPRRVRTPAYPTATPLFVDRVTGRVDWHRGPSVRSLSVSPRPVH